LKISKPLGISNYCSFFIVVKWFKASAFKVNCPSLKIENTFWAHAATWWQKLRAVISYLNKNN